MNISKNHPGKKDLYKKRKLEDGHNVKMFIDREIFGDLEKVAKIRYNDKKSDAFRSILMDCCRTFNMIAERFSRGIEFSVLLNIGISETVADFYFQYKKLLDLARERGRYNELYNEIKSNQLNILFSAIKYPKKDKFVSFNIAAMEEALPHLNGNALSVLLLLKMRSSIPSGVSGVTGLGDFKIAEILQINRSTVYRARMLLIEKGLISILYKGFLKIKCSSSRQIKVSTC